MTTSTKDLLRLRIGTGIDTRALTSDESRAIAIAPAMHIAPTASSGLTPIQSQRSDGVAVSRSEKDELPAGTWH